MISGEMDKMSAKVSTPHTELSEGIIRAAQMDIMFDYLTLCVNYRRSINSTWSHINHCT
jgi:hypothetical protein